ncbi:GNAT family N-acetyltransferase [Jeotgalibacillus sp. ET6]|uniref:GNAT family N-acetyltransferase n=1 Tax=Jeotgalibacillus sp. ET6 TaxID=3037260 RepID=UPI0024183CE6|nr:GNAT family N-acetyltransferase [Jeotgalibacillus sp. ET6]MDG5472140.1 GNAT family N-acetyltransferase [Jeotgalibacillus sp. ET6]
MKIKTKRLEIRDFNTEDWREVYLYTSNKDVMTYMPEGVLSKEAVKEFVDKNSGEDAEKFPIILRENDQLIGHLVFHPYFGDHTYEIGWVMNPAYQKNGYASEAARAVLEYGFGELKLHRIIATCQPENEASFRVMEKIGMRKEGFFKKCIPHENGWWDEYYYAILSDEMEN